MLVQVGVLQTNCRGIDEAVGGQPAVSRQSGGDK